jgi:hypothetical protein
MKKAAFGAGDPLTQAAFGTGDPPKNKEIPTVVTARYTGDFKTAAAQAESKKPDNPEDVIARNIKETVCRCCQSCR